MTESFGDKVEYLANDLREQANDLRVDNFLSFIYTSDIMNKYLDYRLRQLGYNWTLMNILHNLVTHEGTMTPTELSKRVLRSKHAITKSIDTLERAGLLRRDKLGQRDRRLRKVTITQKGLNFVKKGMSPRKALTAEVMFCFDQKEAELFSANMKKLRKHLLKLLEM